MSAGCSVYCSAKCLDQARTIRRLRALADGYRARAERNGQAAQAKCGTCHEQGAREERARIVARLREWAAESDMHAFRADLRWAAEFIESEEP